MKKESNLSNNSTKTHNKAKKLTSQKLASILNLIKNPKNHNNNNLTKITNKQIKNPKNKNNLHQNVKEYKM